MLTHPTIEKLKAMKLTGMVKALDEQMQQSDLSDLSFDQRLALIVDREDIERQNRRLQSRLKKAKLKHIAAFEDIDFKAPRHLDKALLMQLASCEWVQAHHNILIVGPTGTGKTFLACALSHKACLEGYRSHYTRMPRLLPELGLAKGDGSYCKRMKELAKNDVLILDDWGLLNMQAEHRRDLLEVLDDRHGKCSTIVTSQLPVKLWHDSIQDDTFADAILDRLIHNAYRIEMKGESMRKSRANLTGQKVK